MPQEPERPVLFHDLEATGRFIRDTAIGGLLHRGVSYREVRALDSVHVTVDGTRVTAHVDQYSPLNHTRQGRFRYSLPGVMAHWAQDVIGRSFRCAMGRAKTDHCRLECDIVWVPDEDVVDWSDESDD